MDISFQIAGFSAIVFGMMWYALAETRGARLLRLAWLVAAVFGLAFFAYAAISYLRLPFYLDHVEPAVAAIGYAALHNDQPMFHSSSAPSSYNLPYGPALYLLNILPLSLLGPGIVASKAAGVAGLFLTCLLLWLSLKKQGATGWRATVSVLAMLALVMTTDDEAYWNRPEPFLLLSMALGLYTLADPRHRKSLFGLAFAIALAVDLKPHALLYFLPLIWSAYGSSGAKRIAICLALIPLLAALPFLLSQISLAAYIEVLRKTAHHTFVSTILWDNLFFLGILLGPLFLAGMIRNYSRQPLSRQDWLNLGIMLLASLIVAVIGAKAGAGRRHLWPFVPLILATAHRHWPTWKDLAGGRSLQAGILTSLVLYAANSLGVQSGMLEYMQRPLQQQLAATQELTEMMRIAGDRSIEMGYGHAADYQATFVRPLLVYAGQPYHMDAAALMDMKFYGADIAQIWAGNFAACRPRLWVVPHSQDDSFMIPNAYSASQTDTGSKEMGNTLFGDAFRAQFKQRYVKIHEGGVFDLYQCR